jgi:hypothetical protein
MRALKGRIRRQQRANERRAASSTANTRVSVETRLDDGPRAVMRKSIAILTKPGMAKERSRRRRSIASRTERRQPRGRSPASIPTYGVASGWAFFGKRRPPHAALPDPCANEGAQESRGVLAQRAFRNADEQQSASSPCREQNERFARGRPGVGEEP